VKPGCAADFGDGFAAFSLFIGVHCLHELKQEEDSVSMKKLSILLITILCAVSSPFSWTEAANVALNPWMQSQDWIRDQDAPTLSLGEPGAWDDTHIFAPCVAFEKETFSLWYCGSRGEVAQRVFQMGLATSTDGVNFKKWGANPVFNFGDGKRSVLSPTLLRGADGSLLREKGRLRMWFASHDFTDPNSVHTLHEISSADGVRWSSPSASQLEHVYAPTILKDGDAYRMWYVDVESEPWRIRHAESSDGASWRVSQKPCLVIDQDWEERRLFYPTVVKSKDIFLLWYGAYWSGHPQMTALGSAASLDGRTWHKNPNNPVFRPEPKNPWESHYTTSQSLVPLDNGAWRMWYATRKTPPHVNKYFAIGTASWKPHLFPVEDVADDWKHRASRLRNAMKDILTLPSEKMALAPRTHRTRTEEAYTIESISYASEPGSRVTALLYLPKERSTSVPAIIIACGHGGSKSAFYAQYAGQLYAKLGFACLVPDTIGEEERHIKGGLGTRAHDLYRFNDEERVAFVKNELKRMVLGKIVWDLIRGVDYLETRPEIDHARVGVAGYSLGGASAGSLAIVDERIRAAVLCGWGFIPGLTVYGKDCTRLPYQAFAETMGFDEMTALLAPHAATLFLSGDSDKVIDPQENGAALKRETLKNIEGAQGILGQDGIENVIAAKFVSGADHRPLFLTRPGVEWMQCHLMHPAQRQRIPEKTVSFGEWVDGQGQTIEKLYNTEERERGTRAVDIGAVYYPPHALACFPEQEQPDPEYTFQGWIDTVLKTNQFETSKH
jgi:dienelactone hydrolase